MLLDALIDFVEANGIYIGGGVGGSHGIMIGVKRGGVSATEADREVVGAWFRARPEVARVEMGALEDAKALLEFDVRSREERLRVAREAMKALTDEDRAKIHAEVGCCVCATTTKFLVEHPRVAAGAALGGIAAIVFGSDKKGRT